MLISFLTVRNDAEEDVIIARTIRGENRQNQPSTGITLRRDEWNLNVNAIMKRNERNWSYLTTVFSPLRKARTKDSVVEDLIGKIESIIEFAFRRRHDR